MILRIPAAVLSLILLSIARAEPSNNSGLEPPTLRPLTLRANAYLSVGQFGDAARTYTEAIEQSPSDYLLYYKRATAYLSLSRHANALEDFDTVLRLTGGTFDKAVLMKAKIKAKEAKWAEAKRLIKQYSKRAGHGDKEAQDLLFAISEGEVSTKKAQQAAKVKNYDVCIEEASKALATASHAVWLRELRTECALSSGDFEQAIGDLTRLTHLVPPSAALFQRISNMSYYLLPPNPQALGTLKQCLHFDPDSKPCRAAHRQIKSFDKEFVRIDALDAAEDWRGLIKRIVTDGFAKQFDEALDASTAGLELPATIVPRKTSPRRLKVQSLACKAYTKSGQVGKGGEWCDAALAIDENDLDALVGRAEAKLAKEEWEDAVRAFEKAFEASGRSSQAINERLDRARRLLKVSRQKDYYKVLGVSRDADARTIKKAYRRAAMKAHPDKGGSETKMAAVNEAYEVLSNPELRARFDNGDDPNDPTSGRDGPGGGNPFAHFHQGGFPGGQFQQSFFQGGGQHFQWGGGF